MTIFFHHHLLRSLSPLFCNANSASKIKKIAMYKVLLILLFQIVLIETRPCLNRLILSVFNLYILSQHYVSIKKKVISLCQIKPLIIMY